MLITLSSFLLTFASLANANNLGDLFPVTASKVSCAVASLFHPSTCCFRDHSTGGWINKECTPEIRPSCLRLNMLLDVQRNEDQAINYCFGVCDITSEDNLGECRERCYIKGHRDYDVRQFVKCDTQSDGELTPVPEYHTSSDNAGTILE